MKPLIIFKGQSVKVMDNHGLFLHSSPNGWIDGETKAIWLTHFLNYIDKSRKNLLLLDGHSSNFDPQFISTARTNNIEVIAFPANLTHLLQPLDQNFFRILKDNLRKQLVKMKVKEKWDICSFLVDPFHLSTSEGIITASFEIPGIFPPKWNLDKYFRGVKKDELEENYEPPQQIQAPDKSISLPETINTQIVTQEINNNELTNNS
jgi:hypothetical protein